MTPGQRIYVYNVSLVLYMHTYKFTYLAIN